MGQSSIKKDPASVGNHHVSTGKLGRTKHTLLLSKLTEYLSKINATTQRETIHTRVENDS
jgi:hypothetical protein